jgi:hypothetical protein
MTRLCALAALVAVASAVGVDTASPASGGGLAATPNPLVFGNVAVGNSKILPLTITNTGNQTIPTGGLAGSFKGGADLSAWWALFDTTCPPYPLGLAPGQSCTVPVTFKPLKSGTHKSHLVLQDDLGDTLSVPVSGNGT